MSERELPQPWPVGPAPGPWRFKEESPGLWVVEDAGFGHVCECDEPDVAELVAALPEWIEDRDRWKARAEQAEAERGAATDRATEHEMVLSAIADVCVSADHTSDMQRVNVIMDLLTAHGYAREAADV